MGVTTRSVQSERRVRVKLHRNAKTTPHMRALLVEPVRVRRWRVSSAAKAAGVSRRTAFKWLGRWRDGGAAGLEDRPSTPLRQPRRTSPARVAGIVAARQQCLTAWAIGVQLQIPRSTVAAVLARLGLNRLARLAPVEPVIRYERSRPGELVHLDIKRWLAFSASATGSTATEARSWPALATNMCTSPSTISVASPMPKSCRT